MSEEAPTIGFSRLAPLLLKAGLPEDRHEEMVEGINGFTTLMVALMQANEDVAPNYLTFAMITPEGKRYELTVQACGGKTPVEVINELKEEGESLKEELAGYVADSEERQYE